MYARSLGDDEMVEKPGLVNKWIILLVFLLLLAAAVPVATAAVLPDVRHIFFHVANDNGVKYDWDGARYGAGNNDTYYIKADGGGLNELHITNDAAVAAGQVSVSTSQSGVFYVSNTGGRGYDNDIIILLAVNGTIPDDFSVHIKSSGYNWTPATPGAYTPTTPPSDYGYIAGSIDETFTKADFTYGPQTWKPGPGTFGVPSLPHYYGQDINDASNPFQMMFIDLYVGNLYPSKFPGATLVDGGSAKVEYSFNNLETFAAFNGYGWCSASNQDQGISWTNQITGVSASGFTVLGVPPAPTPIIIQGQTNVPTDPDGDGIDEDMNGNGIKDFNDLVIFFNKMEWIQANEPVSLFDFNHNGIIDFNDIVRLFQEL
jgi:PKD repeat protein